MTERQKKVTRPLRKFTEEQMQKIDQMAEDNCHIDTIAMALEIPRETLNRRFGGYIRQKRAEGRTRLRRAQVEAALKGNPALLIFLGKNELGQKDAQDLNLSGNIKFEFKDPE